jgi:hypothetical protein
MTTKYINGSYPNGYTIANAIGTLSVGPAAQLKGNNDGLATAAGRTEGVEIVNSGSISGVAAGVAVGVRGVIINDGSMTSQGGGGLQMTAGTVMNGSSTDNAAFIYGLFGVSIAGIGRIINYGTIASASPSGPSPSETSVSIGGGQVANYGYISAGVDIGASSSSALLSNNGHIGAASYNYRSFPYGRIATYPGVSMAGAGEIKNGMTDHSAVISGGVDITGKGKVVNDGTISGGYGDNYGVGGFYPSGSSGTGPSVDLSQGGTVLNGSGGVTSAMLSNGVVVAGNAGQVVNYGFIGHTSNAQFAYSPGSGGSGSGQGPSVWLQAGGQVVNGSVADTTAEMDAGVWISGGPGSVRNFGSLGSRYVMSYNVSNYYAAIRNTSHPFSVSMSAGGTVFNGSTADTTARIGGGVTISGGSGTLINFGSIGHASATSTYSNSHYNTKTVSNAAYSSALLSDGGKVINGDSSHTTALLDAGVTISGSAGLVMNFGTTGYAVRSTDANGTTNTTLLASIDLEAGGAVMNGSTADTAARIDGGSAGVFIAAGLGEVANFGSITTEAGISDFAAGVWLAGGGTVANGASNSTAALISGYDAGIYIAGGAGTIANFGSIAETAPSGAALAMGPQAGIDLKAGGRVINGGEVDSAASISGVLGVDIYGAGTIANSGAISGSTAAIVFHDASDRLIEYASGKLTGSVMGGGGSLVLEGATGTLTGLGSTVAGFDKIDVAAGAAWVLAGHGSIASGTGFRNDGRIAVAASDTLTLDAGMVGSGTLIVRRGATVEIKGVVSATETVSFSGTTAELVLDSPTSFLGAVSNLSGGGTDGLKLIGFGAGTTYAFSANGANTGGTLSVTDGGRHAQIALLGQFAASGFHAAISANYTVFTYAPAHAAVPHLAPGT